MASHFSISRNISKGNRGIPMVKMNRKDKDHLNLLCDIGELAGLLAGSENIENFLQRTIELVARHMNANVCSIYLLDENSQELVLKATVGLHPAVVRSLARIVRAAKHRNKEISVCGELAHDQKYIPFLLGIGIRALSVYPKFLPSVQKSIVNLKFSDAKFYAEQLLSKNSLKGTAETLRRLTRTFGFNETRWRVEYEQ